MRLSNVSLSWFRKQFQWNWRFGTSLISSKGFGCRRLWTGQCQTRPFDGSGVRLGLGHADDKFLQENQEFQKVSVNSRHRQSLTLEPLQILHEVFWRSQRCWTADLRLCLGKCGEMGSTDRCLAEAHSGRQVRFFVSRSSGGRLHESFFPIQWAARLVQKRHIQRVVLHFGWRLGLVECRAGRGNRLQWPEVIYADFPLVSF